jgi:hypothetical protein
MPEGDERQVVLHPSFLKDYETDESDSKVFISLWQRAAEELRKADHTFMIGYSLPRADSAALTLLLTNQRRGKMTVVNPSGGTEMRLGSLFGANPFAQTLRFEDWVDAGCPPRIANSRPWVKD